MASTPGVPLQGRPAGRATSMASAALSGMPHSAARHAGEIPCTGSHLSERVKWDTDAESEISLVGFSGRFVRLGHVHGNAILSDACCSTGRSNIVS